MLVWAKKFIIPLFVFVPALLHYLSIIRNFSGMDRQRNEENAETTEAEHPERETRKNEKPSRQTQVSRRRRTSARWS